MVVILTEGLPLLEVYQNRLFSTLKLVDGNTLGEFQKFSYFLYLGEKSLREFSSTRKNVRRPSEALSLKLMPSFSCRRFLKGRVIRIISLTQKLSNLLYQKTNI